ncbi:MAG: Gfo/Idh/MocA family oxidoreductase [Chlorobi bacterium]|nr:Gfo/Idh/MocA family oxidoreductase [Chlorobiota bacterium]
MDKTKVGIIGLGGIAQLVHLPILKKMSNVEIFAASEINRNRNKVLSEKFNIKNSYTDYHKMLEMDELEAVIIATPTNTHEKIALDCLNAGKNILLEKPGSKNLEEAERINKAAKKNKKIAMVGMNPRFRPDAMLLKSLINSGELGEIFYIRSGWTRKRSSAEKWFLKKSSAGGGVMIDLGIGLLDLSMWLLNNPKPKSVTVQTYFHETKTVEDSAIAMIRFQNSAVINFEVSWSFHSETDKFTLSTYGRDGTAHLNPLRAYRRIESSRLDYTPAKTTNLKNLYQRSYENELKHFVGSVRSDTKVISSVEELISTMRLLEGFYKSASLGKEITF